MKLDTDATTDDTTMASPTFGKRPDRPGTQPVVAAPDHSDYHDADDAEFEDARPDDASVGKRRGRSRSARRPTVVFLNFAMTLAVAGAIAAVVGVQVAKSRFEAPGPLAEDATFTVRDGATLSAVARDLENRGMIGNVGPVEGATLFTAGARLTGRDTAIKKGEFAIPAGASMAAILNELVDGRPVEFRVTIPEGLTVWQASQRIADHPELTGDMPTPMPAEGMMAAETITFARGATRASVVEQLTRLQEQRINAAWEGRSPDAPVESPMELLTLASIIEKETAIAEERGLVAGVFANRVRENWHLNTDPTLIYGVFGGRGLPDGRPIMQSDKEDRNPYNTYIFRGLPPGPIAIPGRASLQAAANPADTDAMFFVADGTGGHTFSASMDAHNDAVADLRRREREQRAARSSDGAVAVPERTAIEAIAEETVVVETADPVADPVAALDPDAPTPAPPPPAFVEDGAPAPGIPVPLMRPGG